VFEAVRRLTTGTVIDRYLPPAQRPGAYQALAAMCRRALAEAPAGSDRQLAAARGLVRCAATADAGWLRAWLRGDELPAGLEVDADLRWALVYRLAVLGAADEERIAAEQERDRTARGVQEATRCRAARPDPAAKQQAWHIVAADRDRSNRVVVAAAEGFWQPEQAELTRPYVRRYFADIGVGAQWRTDQMLVAVAGAAYPAYEAEPATLAAAEEFLARADVHPGLRRVVLDATDDLRRAIAVRAAGGAQ
jgi:aminopeptidase N